ncbi:3-oxoacyl-[acyl-carrier-protein] synthase III C-terminal domain-containing protein [Arsenophonus endosymbiont of Aleurodicus floccissimus]|uniref:3-oxoacyl-[acyl-carrier-protein] synthase III C-terminal domain-containing protein n=1 Tax=Arsenophonus endosymbiont of Aleurodicus floccissimus TaxID=2152761 RepID=UPI0034E2F977
MSDIRYFYIYDPTSWVTEVAAKVLQVSENKILTLFDKYGSLGLAQNFFALIELNTSSDLFPDDLIILFGFGPLSTSTSFLLSWRKIPTAIDFISV